MFGLIFNKFLDLNYIFKILKIFKFNDNPNFTKY